jgi:multidrug efflux pump subunit AcrA (membrane-fusion protein)
MSRNHSLFSRLIPLALVLAGGLSGCSSELQPAAAAPETVHNVSVLPVQRADVPDLLEAVGLVRATQTKAASQMSGTSLEIQCIRGSRAARAGAGGR